MAYVYRYIDNSDGIIKYVGIVWSEDRTLTQRIYEHQRNDDWCKNGDFTIEYIESNINTRTDAEYFEAHYISLYGTDKYFNEKKSGWGVSSFLPDRENDWKKYDGAFREKIVKGETISTIDMAKSLVDELFTLETDKDRMSFGRKLRAKKNRHTLKSDEEYKYWNVVMDLIDQEVANRLFGDNYNSSEMNVFIDGAGQITVDLEGFGRLICYPNDSTFKMPYIQNKVFNKDDFVKYLDIVIEKLNTYKTAFA